MFRINYVWPDVRRLGWRFIVSDHQAIFGWVAGLMVSIEGRSTLLLGRMPVTSFIL
jgi:hypothetical protein